MIQSASKIIPIESLHNIEENLILVKLRIVFYGSLLKILFDLSYVWALQVKWSSLFLVDANLPSILLSGISIVILLLALPVQKDTANYFLSILLFAVIIPMSTIFAFQSRSCQYFLFVCISFLFVEIVLGKFGVLSYNYNKNIGCLTRYAFYIIVLATVIWLFIELGMPTLTALDWTSVYILRSSYDISSHLSRLSRITAMTIIPILFADSLLARKYWVSAIFCVAQLLIYLWLGHKIYLFMFAVVVFSAKIANMKNKQHVIILTLKALLAVIMLLTVSEIVGNEYSSKIAGAASSGYSYVARRGLFVPAQLRFDYYDFFVTAKKPTVGFLGTVISPLLTRLGVSDPYASSSYSQAVSTWLGFESNANTGIFGGEMAHFGVWGIPVAAICLLILLLCVRIGNRRNGYIFTMSSSLFPFLYLMNGEVTEIFGFTSLGMLIVALLLYQPMSERVKSTCN
ncbi:MAG TPA: hypothetical protein VFD00_10655 [Thermoclostridium sp.]|nr:hypothetical protein [Thermoclostridium sp.]